jgi:cellobiose PTS system EIIA component
VIIHAGNARSRIASSLQAAENNCFSEAEEILVEAENEINAAHHTQTETIQAEARGDGAEYSILFTHAQDTLMAAMTELNLAKHFITIYKKISKISIETE